MSEVKRKMFTGEQKAKVALEAIKGTKTINEIAQVFGVHPTQVSQWKKELLDNAGSLFEGMAPGPHTGKPHPQTPHEVYQRAIGGGAKIIDTFNGTEEVPKSVQTNWDSAIQRSVNRALS